jgi:hypothetical protein
VVRRSAAPRMVMCRTSIGIIVSYSRRPSLRACFKEAGVEPGTYAAQVVQRAYEWFVEDTIDLKREYKKYYEPEYPTVAAFLYYKYGCSLKDIRALKADLKSGRFVGLVVRSARPYGGLAGFIAYEGKDELVARLLGASWEDVA